MIDENKANELMLNHTQVRDFVLLNDKTDKYRYCFEYQMAVNNVMILEKELETLKTQKSSVILQMNIDWAKEAIEEFSSINEDELKHECKTT